jgi:hypothetical protein
VFASALACVYPHLLSTSFLCVLFMNCMSSFGLYALMLLLFARPLTFTSINLLSLQSKTAAAGTSSTQVFFILVFYLSPGRVLFLYIFLFFLINPFLMFMYTSLFLHHLPPHQLQIRLLMLPHLMLKHRKLYIPQIPFVFNYSEITEFIFLI